jgi:DNA-binding response OmpR family regulator
MNEAWPLERKHTHMTTKILLADGDPLTQQLYGRHLENAGFELVRAWDGLEALEFAAFKRPQLAVVDLQMRGLEGSSAALELKKQKITKGIPVVVMSSDANSHLHKELVLEMGAAVLLTKPCSPQQLLGAIFGLLIEAARNGELMQASTDDWRAEDSRSLPDPQREEARSDVRALCNSEPVFA